MPQFDPSTFTPQLFWLAVTFGVLFFAMWRHALPRISDILETRRQRISDELEKAQAFKSEAEQVAAEYEMALAEARDKAAAALKQAGNDMAAEAEQVAAEYEKALGEARDKAAAALKQSGAEMAAEAAERHESFGTELATRTGAAEQRIAAARDEALGDIKTVAEEVAGAATAKLIGVELSPDQLRGAVEDALRRRE